MALHSSLACYVATGFAAAGVYAAAVLRGKRDAYHVSGLRIALLVGGVSAFAQPFSGDISARAVADLQPAKLAAMEALFVSQEGAPLLIGGIPDTDAQIVRFGIHIPKGLSLLAHHDPNARVTGLNEIPRFAWPNVLISHMAFELMVGAGFALMAVTIWFGFVDLIRRKDWSNPLLHTIAGAAPLGIIALEAGWIVTEVGRQPWVIHSVMLTRDAVTPAPHVVITFLAFTGLYLILGFTLSVLLRRLAQQDAAHG
jgi:cytochrome d ubiquinol oxidase subunit I